MNEVQFMRDQENEAFGSFLIQAIADPLGIPLDKDATKSIDSAIYNETECGAWVKFDEKGIKVGSVVEGSCAEFSERIDLTGIDMTDEGAKELNKRFYEALDRIDTAACEAWNETN